MEIERHLEKIIHDGRGWAVQCLVPADFLSEGYWPFSFYFVGGALPVTDPWPWEGGIPPKYIQEQREKDKRALIAIIQRGAMVWTKEDTVRPIEREEAELIADDKELSKALRGLVFLKTYAQGGRLGVDEHGLPVFEGEDRELDRDNLEAVFLKSRATNQEPWVMVHGAGGEPEYQNPRRYDFNTLVLMVGYQREERLSNEAARNRESQTVGMVQ